MKKIETRTEKSFKNLIFAIFGQGISILMTFISRTVFVYTLGSSYLGINGLFSNILTFLNLAELGVASAITYSLYKPLAEKDIEAIKSIMSFYKKIYIAIGVFIISAGLLMAPFISFFITSDSELEFIEIYFLLYVINTGISYFFSYKRTLISADQQQYINTIIQYTVLVIQNVVQIIILFVFKSFILFLVVQILATLVQNIAVSIKANRLYPYLKEKNVIAIDKSLLNNMKKNISAMFLHKLGSAVVNSTDNIIISKMVNIVSVGVYSNYSLVIGALNQLIGQFFGAITASIGNLGTENNKVALKKTFDKVFFLNNWIYSFCVICCCCMFQDFVSLWIGKNMLLDVKVLFVVLLNFYLNGMRRSVLTFRDALGLYWYDRYKPVFESIINLVVSLVLVLKIGLVGVFIGTTVSCAMTSLWVEPFIFCKYGFPQKELTLLKYFKTFGSYALFLICNMTLCWFVTSKFKFEGWGGLFFKLFIVIVVSNIMFVIVFLKSENFKWLIDEMKAFYIRLIK